MIEVPTELLVNQPTVTVVGNTFVSIENYLSIITYETELIKVKTKGKIVKISGDKLSLKYITEGEIGIKGTIYTIEYID